MKFKITEPRSYTIKADSIEEVAEKYAEQIVKKAEIEIEEDNSIEFWDNITHLKTKAENYCLKNLDTLLNMLGGDIEATEDEIAHYGYFTIEECQKTIAELCRNIDLLEKENSTDI